MPKAQKSRNSSRKISDNSRFSKQTLLFFVVVFAAVGGYLLWKSLAAPAAPAIYLSPSSAVYGVSTSFSVQVRENSGSTTVNSTQINLTYPSSLVDFVSIDPTGSAFPTEVQATGGSGTVSIGATTACNTTCSTVTGDQLIATINFKTKTTGGSAAMAFATGTGLGGAATHTDILGGLGNTYGATFTIDTAPPTVSVTAPSTGAVLAGGSTVNITVSASDAASSVTKVLIYIDGSLATTDTSSPYGYSWNTTSASLANHTIYAKAYDTFNNVATSSTVTISLTDQTAPTTPGSFHSTATAQTSVSLAWTASTDNVGVASYKLKRGGSLIATITPPSLTYQDTGLATNTAYTYTIQAYDAAGNASTAASLNVTTTSYKPGDFNLDGVVDYRDLSIFTSSYLVDAGGDLNGDGITNYLDLSIFASNYGT